jgi:hypothetical protein
MTVLEMARALEHTPLAVAIAKSTWLFPLIETLHVLAFTVVVGSVSMLDVRLLGLGNMRRPLNELMRGVLPWAWIAFVVAAICGALLFSSKASTYYVNLPFRIQFACRYLLVNMIVFHSARDIPNLGPPPRGRGIAGAISLILWLAIVGSGRWIGFTTLRATAQNPGVGLGSRDKGSSPCNQATRRPLLRPPIAGSSRSVAWTHECSALGARRWAEPPSPKSPSNSTIDFVPLSERYGTPRRLFTIWFSCNLTLLGVAAGTLGVSQGLSFALAVLAIAVGSAIGSVFVAAHSAQGPTLGIPQMIQSRAQFGVLGASIPLGASS